MNAPAKTKSKGVVAGIASHLNFNVESKILDNEGRFIVIKGQLYSEATVLVNAYVPNEQHLQYYFKNNPKSNMIILITRLLQVILMV